MRPPMHSIWKGFAAVLLLSSLSSPAQQTLPILVDGEPLIEYQAEPIANPKGGDAFKGSHFIHPLKTPSGFVITQIQPNDHKHHFGLWWPWKYIETNGRKVLCWELQRGDGIIQAAESKQLDNGLITSSHYIDRKAKGGPVVLLHETTTLTASAITEVPLTGYNLDLSIAQKSATDQPITVSTHHYSGFSIRATADWNKTNSTVLTSEGKDRHTANGSQARWVRIEGETPNVKTAGLLMMSHPSNQAHPEKLRTWNQQHDGAIFINFNPVADTDWVYQPDKTYTRNYRLFIYDGALSEDNADALWNSYATGS
ncbi:PmoA family protein [Rubellicoccus peritrichatus]|uniref:PmoA family protein n=1 Tax=Rubellicoccus peritrichatus TaxID=3080537 RepID=A0AAQ3L941_9BACT|nr:PmoA family protein [Puniceicoccus sp. CR14]WOO41361.1 PmoA family protein [Puniceicoccus sp. CR14]